MERVSFILMEMLIKMLLADESLRERLAAAGRDLARTRYDWRLIASQMGAIYHEYGI